MKISRLWWDMVREMRPDWEPRQDWWREHCFGFLRTGRYFIFAAEEGGKIVGFLDYFIFPEPSTGKIHAVGQHFYVKPEYRRTRVAWHLYQSAFMAAKQRAENIDLFCFPEEEKFWKKRGFKPIRLSMRLGVQNV